MKTSAVILVCILAICSVWTVHGSNLEVDNDDEKQVDMEITVEAQELLPGVCWACKWALKKVKNVIGSNVTAERVKPKLLSVCDQIGLLKSLCRKFVKLHLGELIEELSTTDDVKTICINTGACKPKELLFNLSDEDPQIEMSADPEVMGG